MKNNLMSILSKINKSLFRLCISVELLNDKKIFVSYRFFHELKKKSDALRGYIETFLISTKE
jgi:hypothetical protein